MVPGAGQALSPSNVDGDIFIGEDFTQAEWLISGNGYINGDLTIRAGGTVVVTNGDLIFRSWDGHIGQLTIEDGGQLLLVNSTLRTEPVLYDVWNALGVLVRNGGVLYAEDSDLTFNGKVLVDNAAFIAHRSTVSGPLFTAMSSVVEMYDSEMIEVPGRPLREEQVYSYPFATGANQSVDVTYLFERNPDAVSTGQNVTSLQMNDSANVTVANGEILTVSGFDIGGLVFNEGEAASITLKVEYRTADDFTLVGPFDVFQYAEYLATPVNTGMSVEATYEPSNPSATNQEMVLSHSLPTDLSSIELSLLSVTYTNTKTQNVYIDRIWVEVELEIPAYHNITVAGTSELTAVNSMLGVNHLNYTDSSLNEFNEIVYNYRKLVVWGAAQANLYGVTVEGDYSEVGVGPYVIEQDTILVKPLTKGDIDNVPNSLYNLQNDEDTYYVVDEGETLHVNSFATAGMSFYLESATIMIEYIGNPGYTSSQYVQWNITGSDLQNTNILVQGTVTQTPSYVLPAGVITNINQLENLNIVFSNPEDSGVSFDWIWVIGVLNPSINVYRWVDAKVVDSNNLPVDGAYVNATESLDGALPRYYYNSMVNTVPPLGVLEYLGKDATNYMVTNNSGMVKIPLLTDIINANWVENSYAIENYRIDVEYTNVSAVLFIPSAQYPGFGSYPSLLVQSFEMLFVLDDLELDLPDIELLNFNAVARSMEPGTIYQGDTVDLYFQVTNNGLTTASRFSITVFDAIGNVTNDLGTINVTNLQPGEVRDLSVVWMSNYTSVGTHSIIMTADSLNEVYEYDESNVLTVQVVVLPFLPDLAVTQAGIVFSQNPASAKQPMDITVTVSNELGKLVAMNVRVSFYLGNPQAGGSLQGTNFMEVASGATNTTTFTWTPIQIGSYPIYVTVNEGRTIAEYSYANNMASNTTVVVLMADTNDWLVNTEWPEIYGATLNWQYNIIVEDEGYLHLASTNLYMNQVSVNTPTQIVVRDSGTLVLDHSVVDSNRVLRIYLFDDASVYINSSTLNTNVVLILDGTSYIHLQESIVRGDVQAPASSSAEMVAVNTTFGRAWSYFGGTSTAELTGVGINGVPPIAPKDGAVVTLYSWIVASVYDGTGDHKIPDAYVEARSFIDSNLYATGFTDENGEWRFRALSDIITASGQGSAVSGYYTLNATFWFMGERYDSDRDKVAQVQYNPDVPLVRNDAQVRLDISSAKPDIDPPFTVSNDEPLRGSEVTLSTVINNIGVVTAYDVRVRFKDNTTGWMQDYIIDELPALANVSVSVTWTATYPLGTHILSVMVDPLDDIPELDEDNNYNSTTVNVLGVPDLLVTATDISVSPTSPIRDKEASISVNVRNIGDNAISSFNVSFYDQGDLIGEREISNLPSGQIGVASITWTPSVPGLRTVTVVVDEEDIIPESNEANNQASLNVAVRNYPDLLASSVSFAVGGVAASKAFVNQVVTINVAVYNTGESVAENFDVVFWLNEEEIIDVVRVNSLNEGGLITVSATWTAVIVPGEGLYQNNTITAVVNPPSDATITHIPEMDDPLNANNQASQVIQVVDNRPDMAAINGSIESMGDEVSSAAIGERVQIKFTVRNVGIIDGTNIVVSVHLVNSTMEMQIFTQTVNLAAGASLAYDVPYTVNVTSGNYSVLIDVDAGADSDQSDNVLDLDFRVNVPSPIITINLGGKFDYAPGTNIFVQGTVVQSGNNAPLIGQNIVVKIVDSTGFPLTSEYTATTNANGQFSAWVPVPANKEGSQILRVTLDSIGGEFDRDQAITIVAPFAPETIPTWVYLLIVAVVIAVIVIFSIYLYRVGLGRMVECGNCGALIPESSRHCPKCGVEFESDTAKCSECGAWIPAKAESCPDCGAKFMTEPMEPGEAPGYIEAMRKQYEEYIEGFRGQAKAALGSKYSEEKFMEWLQTEPNYLPFEEWLRKEEMARRSGVFPCPACGTLNPRESKICNRCGTVFEQHGRTEEAPKPEEKKSPFRRIVRRSSEPKEQKPAEPEAPKTEETGDKPQ